jgi:hypothetical protein
LPTVGTAMMLRGEREMWRGSDTDSFWLQDLKAVGYILCAPFAYVQCIAWHLGSGSGR